MIMPIFVIKILVLAFFIMILINILIYQIIVFIVIKKFINPYLFCRKLILQNTKFVGLFNQGDFGKGRFLVKPVAEMGKIINTTFFYLNTVDDKGKMHQYTIKVSTVFLFIRKVILKSKAENIEIELTRSR